MKALFEHLMLHLRSALHQIRWPRWYFAGALASLLLLSVELVGTWLGFAWLFLGFVVYGFKRQQ